MKRVLIILLLLTSFISLSACSNQQATSEEPKDDGVVVKIRKSNFVDLFEDDIKDRLVNIVEGGISEQLLTFAGTKFPDIKFKDNEGNPVQLLKEKTILLEVVSPHCGYCKEMTKSKVIDEVITNNENVIFYQYFNGGIASDVDAFYQECVIEIPERLNILVGNIEFDKWLDENNFTSVPLFLVINNEGKVGLSHVGTCGADVIDELIDITENELHKPLKDGDKNFYTFMDEQRAARAYINDLEEVTVPKEYYN